jgi:leader peptidase (prepilin peptidase)/N-methyltransferase
LFTSVIELFHQSPAYFYSTVVIFSLLVGSFLNVVIYRLPIMLEQGWYEDCREFLADELAKPKSSDKTERKYANQTKITLSTPNSSCPHCKHEIRFYENIPVISWLLLKGKCSQCHQPISMRYPIIETLTAITGFVIAQHYGVSFAMLAALFLTFALIALTMIDFDHMLLPDQITLPFLWLGLLVNVSGVYVPLADAVIGAAAGYLSLFSIFWLFKLLTGKEGMGEGDFKLFALFGAWIGWQLLPILILMASVVGAIVGISLIVFGKHEKQKPIPFGPYLAIAGWITMLWGENIWSWYLGLIS